MGYSHVHGQDNNTIIESREVSIKGQIIDSLDGNPVPFGAIVKARTHRGTMCDSKGYFSIKVYNTDSLLFSAIGYTDELFQIPSSYNSDSILIVKVRPKVLLLDEVEVTGNAPKICIDDLGTGKPVDISPELRGDDYNSKPTFSDFKNHQISVLHYYLGHREIEKRKTRAAMKEQLEWEKLASIYNKDLVMSLTGLNSLQADTFMIYLNSKDLFSAQSTKYEIIKMIQTQYNNYRDKN